MATPESLFGRIVDGSDVEQWCLDTLKAWSSTYLAERERQKGLQAGTLQRVRAWVVTPTFDKWPEDQLPACLLISTGLAEPPMKSGDGVYRARFQMGLGCIVSARTELETHRLAQLYISAHRALLIQRPSLGGNAIGIVWQEENYDSLTYDDQRSLGAGQAIFTVEVDDVVSTGRGPNRPDIPLSPDTDPWPSDPVVQTHDEAVENYPPPATLPD